MVIETRAGVPIGVLDEGLQRLQTQIDEHSGAIEELHAKFDRLEAKVDNGLDNLQAMMRELLQKQPGVEQPAVQPVVEQPVVEPRQEVQTPTRVQGNLGDQIPGAPREIHGVPLGAEMRNAMPMRPLNQDFKAQANQPRVGMQMGEFFENGQNEPILGEFGDPIEERRNLRNNARFMPPFQGHFDAPYEEPWLGRRQGTQQGQQGQRPARERPRKYQGAHHRDPYWQEQDGPPWNQGRARDPRPMKLDFPRFKGGDPTAWVYRALQYFHYYQILEPEKCKTIYASAKVNTYAMSERRKKGLCYNCDERWSLDHRCKNRKLYLMEEVDDEEAELVEVEEEEVEAELEDEKAEITLCALLGSTSPSTMRVIAILNGQKTVVLLDTGSTHNFMDETLAKTLKLPIDVESNFGVRVANGQVIRTLGECKEVKFKMQGLHLKLTFNLLELGGCGIVLGTQWLSTLGVISWDFKNLVMGFMHEGKQVWLQGLKEKPNLIQVNKSLEHYLRAFVADKPSLWVEWLPLAEYWFNTNYHTSTKLSPFEALYGYSPPRLIEFVPGLTRVAAVEDLLEHRQQVVGLLEHNLVAAQARMKQQADKHRSERKFEVGDWVFLRLQPFRQKSMRKKLGKLSPKFYGPYKVIQRAGMVAYKLELPEGACIHPVFHVFFLKAKLGKTITPISRLPPMDALGHLAPQPAKILETRTIKKRRLPAVTEVLVQWEGGDLDDATWELLFKLQEDYPHLVGKVF
uniref:Chromo domain-containing protein n=1 Tax=Fagus sylvatica TaxID=28930 RepID=A0A2N9I334_FAGSY